MTSTSSKVSVKPQTTSLINSVPSNNPTYSTYESDISGNFVLIWMNFDVHPSNSNDNDIQSYINRLQIIINSIKMFNNLDQCVDFLTDLVDEKVFMIISGRIDQQFISILHQLIQLNSIYLFSNEKLNTKQWIKQYKKVKGIFPHIETICNTLQQDIHQLNNNLTSISIIPSSSSINLDELDQSFMYSQLLKEIILDMSYTNDAKQKFVYFCRSHYQGNHTQMKLIDQFEQNYQRSLSIWWYTRDSFLYWMLNKALRTQDTEMIIKMGFFLQDLHYQIQDLYSKTKNDKYNIVFRGQGIAHEEFDKIKRSKGGLLSFNNFLSTSIDRQVAYLYADSAQQNTEYVGTIFQITIDRKVSPTPFASVKEFSYFSDAEDEILFSMHTIFRISDIKQIQDGLWQVNLMLTNEKGSELGQLMESMRQAIKGKTPLSRLAELMFYMGEYNKAEEIYQQLLHTSNNNDYQEIGNMYYRLTIISLEKNDFQNSEIYVEKMMNIYQQYSPDMQDMINQLSNSSETPLPSTQEGSFSSLDYEMVLQYQHKVLPSNPLALASRYNIIGNSLQGRNDYPRALSFYHMALKTSEKCFPSNHPSLAIINNNIAMIYHCTDEYLKALSHYKKAIEIGQKSLPSDHLHLATFHRNIGNLYHRTGNYSMGSPVL